jgi:defect-in-organelle-trafficking protein DotD
MITSMKKWLHLLILSSTLLCGCTSLFKKPPVNEPTNDADIRLAEAASSISSSMAEMAQVEKIVTPKHKGNRSTIPNSYNLQTRASVDWAGPIEELTARVAKAAGYHLSVMGKEPSLPILISLNVKDESLVEILRNIDYQAGKRAFIHAYPDRQLIELRYAQNYT